MRDWSVKSDQTVIFGVLFFVTRFIHSQKGLDGIKRVKLRIRERSFVSLKIDNGNGVSCVCFRSSNGNLVNLVVSYERISSHCDLY